MNQDELLSEGFECTGVHHVGVPYFIWVIDFDIEQDRSLRLTEETVLRLIQCGINSQGHLAELMGLDDDVILSNTLLGLLSKNAITFSELDTYSLQPFGTEVLAKSSIQEPQTYSDMRICHDPYTDTFEWFDTDDEGWLMDQQSVQPLLAPSGLTVTSIEARHRDIRQLIERDGLPSDAPLARGQTRPRRDLTRLVALRSWVAYKSGELELWDHAKRDEKRYRLLQAGGEQPEISEAIMNLAAEGQSIVATEKPKSVRGRNQQ